jgi:hypothetical protein
MKILQGYKTLIAMGLALGVGLYQNFAGPLPEVDPNIMAVAVPTVAIILRFLTKGPVGEKVEPPTNVSLE